MQQNLDRFKFRFYHYEDKKIYDVITFQKLPTEEFIRCFLTRPLPNGMSIDDIEEQLKIEERAEQNLILNQKSGIDGDLMQSSGLKDKNGKLIFEGDILETKDKKIFTVQYGLYDTNGKNGKPSCSYGFYLQSHHKEHIADCYKLHQIDDICCYMPPYVIENPIYASEVLGVEIIGNIYEQPQLLEKL